MIFYDFGALTIDEVTNGVIVTRSLLVIAMIYAFGETSGKHFNPARTIGMASAKKIACKQVPNCILAQGIGPVLVVFLLWFLFPYSQSLAETTPVHGFPPSKAAILKFHFTFLLIVFIINNLLEIKKLGLWK